MCFSNSFLSASNQNELISLPRHRKELIKRDDSQYYKSSGVRKFRMSYESGSLEGTRVEHRGGKHPIWPLPQTPFSTLSPSPAAVTRADTSIVLTSCLRPFCFYKTGLELCKKFFLDSRSNANVSRHGSLRLKFFPKSRIAFS